MSTLTTTSETKTNCYHCSDVCNEKFKYDNKSFCCQGCKLVYQFLTENNLNTYYDIESGPGNKVNNQLKGKFEYLDHNEVKDKIIEFKNEGVCRVSFYIPSIHCAACIWLLDNLFKLHNGILVSETDFLRREVLISFDENKISLRQLVELLSSLAYEPALNLNDLEGKKTSDHDKVFTYKLGVAAFAFGNIMLLSFPEYFSIKTGLEDMYFKLFGYLNLLLALPVFFYSSSYYFISAWKGLRQKTINIDVPLALGILVMFVRSSYEILSGSGPGFMDTMAGLVFFLLLGKWFQNKTFKRLSFERDYKSYFPVSITKIIKDQTSTVPLSEIEAGDRILVRNQDIIPADSLLVSKEAHIDYSFVTGEQALIKKQTGDKIYAGGRHNGKAIELIAEKPVSQSYLTKLWNHDVFLKPQEHKITTFANRVSQYFTPALLSIAFASFFYWFPQDSRLAFNAFTAVLIIACPCALALSSPFALGNTLRIFGRKKFFLKNTSTVESLAKADTIVFDKTGTMTFAAESDIKYKGQELNDEVLSAIKKLAFQSNHPLSRKLFEYIKTDQAKDNIIGFKEVPGMGIEGKIRGMYIMAGSKIFVTENRGIQSNMNGNQTTVSDTSIYISIDKKLQGYFKIQNKYREGLNELVKKLGENYELSILSGDNDGEKEKLRTIFGQDVKLNFRQSPDDKLKYIEKLQKEGKKVIMIGDGLNDAGALKQSNAGISISEDVNNFSPACDGILEAGNFHKLNELLRFTKTSMKVVKTSFVLSLLYNVVGLSFAVTGMMSPLFAAILMPLSGVTIVVFVTSATNLLAMRGGDL